MRRINEIILHCSDSDFEQHDNIETIRKWHVEERKFNDIGYHFVITKKGLEIGRPINLPGAHVRGRNSYSIGIVLCGKKNFSSSQFEVLEKLIFNLMHEFNLNPQNIIGHCEIDKNKTCPNFDVKKIRDYFYDLYKRQ